MIRCGAFLLAMFLGAAVSASAAAQEQAPQPIEALAADLAYGFCPQFMSGEAVLDANADLIARGFPAEAQRGVDASLPEFVQLVQARGDGEISVSGVPQSLCRVFVIGDSASAALEAFRAGVDALDLALVPDPENSGARNGGILDSLMVVTADGNMIGVQFFVGALSDGSPLAAFQINVQEQ